MDFSDLKTKVQLDCYKGDNCIEDVYTKLFARIIIIGWYGLSSFRDEILKHSKSEEDCILKIMMISNIFAIKYVSEEEAPMRPHEYLLNIKKSGELVSEMKKVCKII